MREVTRTVSTAVLTAAVTALCMTAVTREPRAFAQAPHSPLAGLTTHVSIAPLTGKMVFTFISESGEIWVYSTEDPWGHYRVREMGQPLEKLKK